jgi:hypothetical protein
MYLNELAGGAERIREQAATVHHLFRENPQGGVKASVHTPQKFGPRALAFYSCLGYG